MVEMMTTWKNFELSYSNPGQDAVLFSWPHNRIRSDSDSVSIVSVPPYARVRFQSPNRR